MITRAGWWLLATIMIAALGPAWAALELGLVPRTITGASVLVVSGPAFIAMAVSIDVLLQWSGRQELLGSLEPSSLRMAIAMAGAVGIVAALLAAGIWFAGSSVTASGLRHFLADNFRCCV